MFLEKFTISGPTLAKAPQNQIAFTNLISGIMAQISPTTIKFVQKLLELSESTWVDADAFAPFVNELQLPAGEAKVDFFQRLVAIIKRMPERVIMNDKRIKIVQAAQEFLDKAIEEEEDKLTEESEDSML